MDTSAVLLAAITALWVALPSDAKGGRVTPERNSQWAVIAEQSRAFRALPGQSWIIIATMGHAT